MTPTSRPEPRRRHDPDMQNYVYKGETAKVAREKALKRSGKFAGDTPPKSTDEKK